MDSYNDALKADCLAICWEQSALVCDHIRSPDEQMHAQLLEVSQYLSVGPLRWYVLFLRVDPQAVQCQPVSNWTNMVILNHTSDKARYAYHSHILNYVKCTTFMTLKN